MIVARWNAAIRLELEGPVGYEGSGREHGVDKLGLIQVLRENSTKSLDLLAPYERE